MMQTNMDLLGLRLLLAWLEDDDESRDFFRHLVRASMPDDTFAMADAMARELAGTSTTGGRERHRRSIVNRMLAHLEAV